MATTTQLSENSHQGFEGIKAALCLASMEAKSNTASGMRACLRQDRIGSRSSGKERDETGLDYFGARYFSGAMGRFTNADAPFADQHQENPQSWNLYQYGYNNPLSNLDVDGRSVWTKIAKVGWKLIKTGNAAAAFAGNIQDARTVFDSDASTGSRIWAGVSLASEILPISIGDAKDAGRILGLTDDAVDAGKQVVKHGDDATVTRYMGPGEAEVVKKSGSVPNVNQDGDFRPTHVTTDAPLDSSSAAKKAYELQESPTHRVTVPADRVGNLSVAPDGRLTTSGGGSQAVTSKPIKVDPDELKKLRK